MKRGEGNFRSYGRATASGTEVRTLGPLSRRMTWTPGRIFHLFRNEIQWR